MPKTKSPLSAELRLHNWRLLSVQASVLLLTAAIGAGFFFTTKFLLESQAADRVKSLGRVMTYGLTQNAPAMSALRSAQREPLVQHVRNVLRRTPQATNIMIVQETADRSTWNVLVSATGSTTPQSISIPPFETAEETDEAVVYASGSTLTAYVQLNNQNTGARELLILETNEDFVWALVKTLVLPFILLAFAGLFMARSVKSYASHGRSEMQQQIDANRLALLELATHQLGAPLATFRWWLELMSDPDGKDVLQNPQVIEQVSQAIDRMDKIVKAMTEANHVEGKSVTYNIETLKSLKHILQRVLDDARPILTRKKQKLTIQLDPALEPIQIDTKLIYGVLQELVQNAMDYSPEETTITITAKNAGDCAQITVADQGFGIPEQDLIHIGEKFTRASNAAQHKPVGNGLGLFIAKGIVENFGGELWVTSRLGHGTTIHFTLPFDKSDHSRQ